MKEIILPFLSMLLLVSGCRTIEPGNRDLVVRSEQVAAIAIDTLDTLFKLEYENAQWVDEHAPEIKTAVNKLRERAPDAIEALRKATKDFKEVDDPSMQAKLQFALSVVSKMITESSALTARLSNHQ